MQEVQLKLEFMSEKFNSKETDYIVLKSDLDKMREENLMLKAAIKEGDKTREILTRQMTVAMHQEIQLQQQNNRQPHSSPQRDMMV